MKVINVTNILADGRIDISNTNRYISQDEFQWQYRHFLVRDGDIVVASSGNTYGKVGRIKPQDLPLMMNTSVIRLHSLQTDVLVDGFLYAFLRSSLFSNQVEAFVIGSAQPNFGPTHLNRMLIPLPPIPLQRRIAEIITSYDELMENNQRRIRILEEMARSLYREWFVHFRFPGNESHPRVRSDLGEIPQGWDAKPVGDCVAVNPKVAVPRVGEKPFIPMSSLSNDSMLISDIEVRGGNSGSKFQVGDTLFARITPCLENGKTGFVYALPNNSPVGFGSTEFIVLRGLTVSPEYVYCLARSEAFRQHAIKSMTGATGRQRVQEASFAQFFIVEPPQSLLARFSAIAAPTFRLIDQLNRQVENLRKTRDLLLPRLLSGQIKLEAH